MKITPVSAANNSTGTPTELGSTGSINPERYARAVAAITGQPVEQATPAADPQVEKAQNSIKRIKMHTQRSVNRYPTESVPVEEAAAVEAAPEVDTLATSEPTEATLDATKPLSPQFAALAKAKRAAQAKEAAIAAREQALAKQEADMRSAQDKLARLKANPLSVLQEEGVTYDQLTESILNQNQTNPDVATLKAEIQAMREEFAKQQTQRDEVQRQQALKMIRKDVDALVAQGDEFEAVREAGYAPKVVELIERWFSETGDILDTTEAARMVENELLEEALHFARLKKVQSRLQPPAPPQQQPAQQAASQPKTLKTLTSRDGTTSSRMSARERAIAAFYGKL